ncbi:unnamed protein product [Schistocephalus solidus]|uniref:Uncharacterized protein n=1 Tax=Schistocephalus solidus TaxID=70667 RepID=A0A183TJA6_SCHSO|nr:unnamed protein product [Schistocephalus solidus]
MHFQYRQQPLVGPLLAFLDVPNQPLPDFDIVLRTTFFFFVFFFFFFFFFFIYCVHRPTYLQPPKSTTD